MNYPKPYLATLVTKDNLFIKAFKTCDKKYKVEEEFYNRIGKTLAERTPHVPRLLKTVNAAGLLDFSPDFAGYACGFCVECVGPKTLKEALPKLSDEDLYIILFQIAHTILCMQRLGVNHNDVYCESNVLVTHLSIPRTYTYIVDGVAKNVRFHWMAHLIDFDQADLYAEKKDIENNHDMFDIIESIDFYDKPRERIPGTLLRRGNALTPQEVIAWVTKHLGDTIIVTTPPMCLAN
jgi:hypothetical protein